MLPALCCQTAPSKLQCRQSPLSLSPEYVVMMPRVSRMCPHPLRASFRMKFPRKEAINAGRVERNTNNRREYDEGHNRKYVTDNRKSQVKPSETLHGETGTCPNLQDLLEKFHCLELGMNDLRAQCISTPSHVCYTTNC